MDSRWRLRPFSFFVSLFIHACLAASLLLLPSGKAAEKPIKLVVYETVKLQKAPVVYWARTTLPSIDPDVRIGDSRLLRGEELSWRERVVVKQPSPDPAKQVIWQPDKPRLLRNETPLRNMVAVKGPVVTEAPPELEEAKPATPADVIVAAGVAAIPRHPAPFVPPPAKRPIAESAGTAPDLSAPPEIAAGGTGSDLSAAVIGLDPSSKMVALPEGSRQASFSRSPNVGPASSGNPQGNSPIVPGVAIVSSRPAPASPGLAPPPPVTAGRTVEIRIPAAASTASAPLRPASRILPREIESRFGSRIVYTLVIAKPDLPEYSADWTIWFSERAQSSPSTGAMRAPYPVRKTVKADSRPAAATAAGIWVQVSAVIGKDGKVSAIAPIPGRSPIVAARAAEDLANWEFRPAQRNGEAIEVDAVIEIPYRVQ